MRYDYKHSYSSEFGRTFSCEKDKLTTILRKMFREGNVWRLCGHAHDYTV